MDAKLYQDLRQITRILLVVWLVCGWSWPAFAQHDWDFAVEEQYNSPAPLDSLSQSAQYAVDINEASIAQWMRMGLSLEAAIGIQKHRIELGDFQSVQELVAIEGVRFDWLLEMSQYLNCATLKPKARLTDYKLSASNNSLALYEDQPWQNRLRVVHSSTKLHLGLHLERDRREPLWYDAAPKGLDYLSGFAAWKNKRGWKAIVGDYDVRFGSGQAIAQPGWFAVADPWKSFATGSSVVVPHQSFVESSFHRGLAVFNTIKDHSIGAFLSRRATDGRYYTEDDRWVKHWSGTHATRFEQLSRKNLMESALGLYGEFQIKSLLKAGLLLRHQVLQDSTPASISQSFGTFSLKRHSTFLSQYGELTLSQLGIHSATLVNFLHAYPGWALAAGARALLQPTISFTYEQPLIDGTGFFLDAFKRLPNKRELQCYLRSDRWVAWGSESTPRLFAYAQWIRKKQFTEIDRLLRITLRTDDVNGTQVSIRAQTLWTPIPQKLTFMLRGEAAQNQRESETGFIGVGQATYSPIRRLKTRIRYTYSSQAAESPLRFSVIEPDLNGQHLVRTYTSLQAASFVNIEYSARLIDVQVYVERRERFGVMEQPSYASFGVLLRGTIHHLPRSKNVELNKKSRE